MTEASCAEQSTPADQIETSTAGNTESYKETETSRSIDELQCAFGSSLSVSENLDPVNEQTSFNSLSWKNSSACTYKAVQSNVRLERTGSFALFSLPRELRNTIYYHYLYSPEGVIYRPETAHNSRVDKHTHVRISIFPTCHQVYDEALQVFCRHAHVQIATTIQRRYHTYYPQALQATFRLFPATHARLLQRLSISLYQYVYFFYPLPNEVPSLGTGAAFLQMLRDASISKDKFPRLRQFAIVFCPALDYMTTEKYEIQGHDDEERIENCAIMMRGWLENEDVVPPIWFKFFFDEHWLYEDLRTLHRV
jgi:hypothetical protein